MEEISSILNFSVKVEKNDEQFQVGRETINPIFTR